MEVIQSNIVSIIISICVSIITVLITEWIKNHGNLKIYIIDYKEQYYSYDDKNRCNKEDEIFTSKTKTVKISVTLDIYNNTSIPKIVRDVKFKILDNEKICIKDKDTEKMLKYSYKIDDINNLNIPAFNVVRKNIQISLNRESYSKSNKFYLVYHNYRNRKKIVKLK